MTSPTHLLRASACLALGAALTLAPLSAQRSASRAPTFQVDPLWPKPLPNHWILGSVTGVAADAQDHIWLVHRGMDSLTARTEAGTGTNPPTAESCCTPAPFVLEFDQAGTLLHSWGGVGQGYDWPRTPAGITVDAKGNVWIAGSASPTGAAGQGPPPADAHVLKFSRDGKFLLQIGQPGKIEGSFSKTTLNRPAGFSLDASANEVYVADGLGNRRVVVFDSETGGYKRHWGAYGQPTNEAPVSTYEPDKAPEKQFRSVSCVRIARDGLVYVCDRQSDRIQVFKKDGAFVKEGLVSKSTLGEGSVWDIAFSHDPQQQFLYVADGSDQKVWVLRRDTLEVVSSVGAGGRWPGHFYGVGNIAVDSKGNLYTGETYEGKRLQKFIYKGLGAPVGEKP
jgi:DNA-binding beta-propeller fold protein YncE